MWLYPIVDGQANCISLYIEETMLAINKDEIVDALVITSELFTRRLDTVSDMMFVCKDEIDDTVIETVDELIWSVETVAFKLLNCVFVEKRSVLWSIPIYTLLLPTSVTNCIGKTGTTPKIAEPTGAELIVFVPSNVEMF